MAVNYSLLSDEELVALASSGDDEAMARLIGVISPIAAAKAASIGSGEMHEDYIQEGMIAFLYAVKSFSPDCGASFRTYASACITNRILSAVRKSNNSKNLALTGAVELDDETVSDAKYSDDPQDIVQSLDEQARIEKLAKTKLSGLEYKVFILRRNGESYSGIAKSLGCDEKSVANALGRIRTKLRPNL